ncbi:nucleotidyltransferase family protein [Mycobacterium sp. OTB74]|jgi:molybdenum cofactor cytidylyltransferase|uniref:nucleotidyltransferase family protein n=1 Tax=Mycobacterium sp. OTB74 TaxID=1853452 RepID=UPI0024742C40|nr:nucleotidyltransferase family protein [Mycobacterium sp. OTB74]MDH6243989.1 molybdenum cofactor cytidylyltransferase [Mycobacterium sp. OTB74]
MTADPLVGVVLAAGSSRRLGTPKQLLPYRDGTLLGATLDVARQCGFDQLIVTLGGAADAIRAEVDLTGTDVVVADAAATGCSTSLRAALGAVRSGAAGIVLLLGDQPGVQPSAVQQLLSSSSSTAIAVGCYIDGVGHPFWLGRNVFDDVRALHGDKGVWKLIESGRHPVVEVALSGTVPPDVDTWDDYQRLLAATS